MEADRRLGALRKNLAREIELDFDKFSGDSPSATAGLMVLARFRIILAFLQAFFPMFITAPKPRRVKKPVSRRARKPRTKKGVGRKVSGRSRGRGGKTSLARVLKLENETETERVIAGEPAIKMGDDSSPLGGGGNDAGFDFGSFSLGENPEVFAPVTVGEVLPQEARETGEKQDATVKVRTRAMGKLKRSTRRSLPSDKTTLETTARTS